MKWKQMEELIDVCLLAQMRMLVFSLSEEKDKNSHMDAVACGSFYWEKPKVERLEEKYGLNYPGEVLERYGEKIGDSLQVLRTLAVAMAEMKLLLSNSMFVENQYEKFIQKVRKEAQKDLICKGALLFLEENPEKKGAIRKELWEYPWNSVMELLFLMSIFKEDGWERWKNSLMTMLGKQRQMEVYGNEGMYAWVIRQYAKKVEGYHKKDLNLLKGLCRLPQGNAMGKSPVRKWLTEDGYSEDEICFLNWGVLEDTMQSPQMLYPSITLERMAVQTCLRFLGSSKEYPREVYELCTKLLTKNKEYDIKLEGERGIFATLGNSDLTVRSVSAYMTLWPYRQEYGVPKQYFWIDLGEEKWDALRDKLGKELYQEKVVDTLAEKAYAPKEFAGCVKHYEELMGEPLLQYFWQECTYSSTVVFQKMMEQNLMDASALVDEYIQEYRELDRKQWKAKWKHMFLNMKPVLFRLKDTKSYAVFQKMIGMFGIENIDELLQEEHAFWELISGNRYRREITETGILSECFDDVQNRQLFLWSEQYVYRKYPECYPDFIYGVLSIKKAAAVIDRDVAVKMAKYLMEHGNLGVKKERLRELYWTEEERKNYEEQKEKEREEKKQERLRELKKTVEEEFRIYQKKMTGINQLGHFLYCQVGQSKEFASQLVASYLKEYSRQHSFHTDKAEAVSLMRFWVTLYENGSLELEELQQYINNLEVE